MGGGAKCEVVTEENVYAHSCRGMTRTFQACTVSVLYSSDADCGAWIQILSGTMIAV